MRLRHLLPVTAVLALAGCADPDAPRLGVGLGFGPHGVSVNPRVTTQVGAARVGVGAHGGSVGTNVGGVGVGAYF